MDKITPIDLFTGKVEDDIFKPNPDDYEEHTLTGDSIRGNVGDVVQVHKNDIAILRANKLIAPEGEETPTDAKPASLIKAKKPAKATQAKAEKAEPAAELAAIPNLADLPGA